MIRILYFMIILKLGLHDAMYLYNLIFYYLITSHFSNCGLTSQSRSTAPSPKGILSRVI